MPRKKRGTPRRRLLRYVTPRRARRGFRGRTFLSPKSTLAGAVGLTLIKKLIGPSSVFGFSLGRWDPAVQKMATGAILNAARLDNWDLVSAGAKEAVAEGITMAIDYATGKAGGGGGGLPTGVAI